MAVKYALLDGELVSREWHAVLTDMRKAGVYFRINEGKRTMERQRYFYSCWRCQCCNNGNLAAFPSPFAPHIRTGRLDHAIDFDGAANVIAGLAKRGIHAALTVPGESWHVEANAGDLSRWFKANKTDPFDVLPRHIRRAVKSFIAARNTVRSRVKDRDRIDSRREPKKWIAKNRLVGRAVEVRARRRSRLERMLGRARSDRTRRVLRQVLDA